MSWAMWSLGKALHKRFDSAQAAFSNLNAIAQECVAGLRALRGLGAAALAAGAFARASDAANAASLSVARIDSRYDPVIYLTVGASFMASIGAGAG
jgi:ABC-type multidrug transport system fused ATPase/permease subunit